MPERTVTATADTLELALQQLSALVPPGHVLISQRIVSDGKPQESSVVTDFERLRNALPRDSKIIERRVLSDAEERCIVVSARDEAQARVKVGSSRRPDEAIVGIGLVAKGKLGFLGIGRIANQYEVRLCRLAKFSVIYQARPHVSGTIASVVDAICGGKGGSWKVDYGLPEGVSLSCEHCHEALPHIVVGGSIHSGAYGGALCPMCGASIRLNVDNRNRHLWLSTAGGENGNHWTCIRCGDSWYENLYTDSCTSPHYEKCPSG